MIYYFLTRQFQLVAKIDTKADKGIVIKDDIHTVGLKNGTRLNSLSMDVYTKTGPKTNTFDPNAPYKSSNIDLANFVIFRDARGKDVCLYIRKNVDIDGKSRSISAVDLGLELQNGSATIFTSNSEQFIDYYVNRELYDTGWEIGINELGTDVKRLIDTNTDETPLARLQKVCQAFNCEMSFDIELQNLQVIRKKVNIRRQIGSYDTGLVFYSTKDIISWQRTSSNDDVITSIQDTNHGFDDLVMGDGRFFTRAGESTVYDREANALYGLGNTFDERFSGYKRGYAASSGDAQIDNYNELRGILEQRSQPTFSAEIDFLFRDDQFEVGDYVTFIDEEANPPLRMKARILEVTQNGSNKRDRKATIGNYEMIKSLISSDLIAKQQQMNQARSTYFIKLMPDNGTSFVAGEEKTTTISATIFKDGVDITSTVSPEDILWFKVDKEGNHDTVWENTNLNAGTSVRVTEVDVNEVSSIRCALTIFDNHFVQAIYFLNGLRDVARKVIRLQSKDTITSIHISDTHYATDTIIRDDLENYGRSNNHIKNAAEFTNFVDVDYVVLDGDTHDGTSANKNVAQANYSEAISTIGLSNCPYFLTWGNHDNNNWGDNRTNSINKVVKNYGATTPLTALHGNLRQVLSNREMYEMTTRPSTIFGIVENPDDKMGYYYYDVPDKKNRVIILNPQDVPLLLDDDGYAKYIGISVSGYRQAQINWFYQTLKNTPADMTVSIFQHFPFGKRYGNLSYYPYNYEMIDGIIDSFVTGGTYNRSYNSNPDFAASISCDFEGRKGTLAFLAHGHMHVDRITKDANGTVNYSIGCSVSRPKKEQGDRPLGVLEEDLWDVIVLNTKTRHVDLIRFGKGADRSFDY